MSGLVVFDSNIIIDHLNDCHAATELILKITERAISAITWMEVMVGVVGTDQDVAGRRILGRFYKIDLTESIQERAIRARKQHRLKLLDAIIYATAQEHNVPLFTRDAKDFPPKDPLIRVPYQL